MQFSHLHPGNSPVYPPPVKMLFSALLLITLSACATMEGRTNQLQLGMTRAQVVKIMGSPKSSSSSAGDEFLHYRVTPDWTLGDPTLSRPFQVQLHDGQVVAWGDLRSFRVDLQQSGSVTNTVRQAP